jgi:hypothetical protein
VNGRAFRSFAFALASVAPAVVFPTYVAAAETPARLVRHLDFEDLRAADTTDRADRSSHAVRHAAAAKGRTGRGLKLSGHPRQVVELGALGFDQPATLALWIWRDPAPVAHPEGAKQPEYTQEHQRGQGRLISRPSVSPSAGLAGALRVGPDKLEVWHGRGWTKLIEAPIPAGEWVHLAMRFDADGRATGFLNGRRQTTVECRFHGREAPLTLASSSGDRGYGYPFAGLIDEVRIYRGALDDAAIKTLAEQPAD